MIDREDDGVTIQTGEQKISFHTPVLSRDISEMSPDKLSEAALELHSLIATYCGYLSEILYIDPKLQDNLFARLQESRRKIDTAKGTGNLKVALNEAIFEVHRVHVSIAKNQELLAKRERLQWISPVVVLVFAVIIVGVIILGRELDESAVMPIIGIPFSVLLWSLIGSVAAILYRFYNYRITKLTQINLQITWLIARPLTGVIMGMVSYVAIVAGLFIFGGETQTTLGAPTIKPQLLWLVAFLAGFSDRFFEGYIQTLVNTLSRSTPEKQGEDDKSKS